MVPNVCIGLLFCYYFITFIEVQSVQEYLALWNSFFDWIVSQFIDPMKSAPIRTSLLFDAQVQEKRNISAVYKSWNHTGPL